MSLPVTALASGHGPSGLLGLTSVQLAALLLGYVALWGLGLLLGDWLSRRHPGGGSHVRLPDAAGPYPDDSGGGLDREYELLVASYRHDRL